MHILEKIKVSIPLKSGQVVQYTHIEEDFEEASCFNPLKVGSGSSIIEYKEEYAKLVTFQSP